MGIGNRLIIMGNPGNCRMKLPLIKVIVRHRGDLEDNVEKSGLRQLGDSQSKAGPTAQAGSRSAPHRQLYFAVFKIQIFKALEKMRSPGSDFKQRIRECAGVFGCVRNRGGG